MTMQAGPPERRAAKARADAPWLVALWALATAYNLFKPFHIDDAAHLLIARWIGAHPLHPMSGLLNWSGVDEPISRTNQPHLYFYLIAGWARVFGWSEPALHLLQSLAALACVFLFHRLARALVGAHALWATAMLVLGPAFIVEQNLMVDTPLLATWLAFFNVIVLGGDSPRQTRRFVLAAAACSAALLVKYSSLVLLPILGAALVVERRRAQAWTLLIPLAALGAWSAFNVWDYGAVHLLTRPQGGAHDTLRPVKFALAWVLALGALTPLGLIAAVEGAMPRPFARGLAYVAAAAALGGLALLVALGAVSDHRADKVLWLAFMANGALAVLTCALAAAPLLRLDRLRRMPGGTEGPRLYLVLWLLGASVFYILLSPFIAARHLLLVLPPVILLVVTALGPRLGRNGQVFGLATTAAVSAGLCLSDWRFAAFPRSEAALLGRTLPPARVRWAKGHWGWQWYAMNSGFREIDVVNSRPAAGDLVVVSEDIDNQALSAPVVLQPQRVDRQAGGLLSLVCTARPVRFYSSSWKEAPWSLSRDCATDAAVYRVRPRP